MLNQEAKPVVPPENLHPGLSGGSKAQPAELAEEWAPPPEERKSWFVDLNQINFKAVAILFGILILLPIIYFPVTYLQANYLRRSALTQARKFVESEQPDQAVAIMTEYLLNWPEDVEGLAYQGELLGLYAASYAQVNEGTKALEQLLRIDPDSPERQVDRKRLVELMVRQGDIVQASNVVVPGAAKQENRYRAANLVAEQRIKLGADDAEAHRLLAITLERLGLVGDAPSTVLAIKEYQKALRRDPGDFLSAERLASLRLEGRKDQAGADQILDDMIKARPKSMQARLVRAKYFLKTNREDRSKTELDAAAKLAPADPGVRLMAASLAIRRGDVAAARRHFEAVPVKDRAYPQVALLAGQIELADNHVEKALEIWRKALIESAGTDVALTWRLAFTLIRLGRDNEARPLMDQFRRLVRRNDHPMLVLLKGFQKDKANKPAAAIVDLTSIRDEVELEWKAELEMTLGRCHLSTGNLKEAQAAFLKARNLQPGWALPRIALARLLFDAAPNLAEEEIDDGIKMSRGLSEATLLASRIQLHTAKQMAQAPETRDWSVVVASIERGQKIAPGDIELAQAAADYLLAVKRSPQALLALEEATRGVGRNREESWLARSSLLARMGRRKEAVAVLEEAANPRNAGDLARFRVTRAYLLLESGQGRAAIESLSRGTERLSSLERATLARSRADILAVLGDLDGARASCQEWATLCPEDTGPGLKLIELAKKGGSADDSELGIDLLRKAGGEDEPNTLAVRAFNLLDADKKAEDIVDSAKLEDAEVLVQRLKEVAPTCPSPRWSRPSCSTGPGATRKRSPSTRSRSSGIRRGKGWLGSSNS